VDVLLGALASVIESRQVSQAINLFSMAAILSSFIGVGLGVFDYLADLFRFDNSRRGGAVLGGDLPAPLALSLMFPFGFVVAIGYAGAAATVWACIIPALLAKKSRELARTRRGSRPRRPAHGGGRHRLRGAYRHLPPDGHGGSAARLHRLTLVC
jgi:tryptophan-specific transport protein